MAYDTHSLYSCVHGGIYGTLINGLNVLVCMQVAPGKYDERGLKSLDFVLEVARKYGLQVVLSFVDNWKYYNGVDQYVDWSTTAPNRTMASPFKDLVGDPTAAIYGTGPAGQFSDG